MIAFCNNNMIKQDTNFVRLMFVLLLLLAAGHTEHDERGECETNVTFTTWSAFFGKSSNSVASVVSAQSIAGNNRPSCENTGCIPGIKNDTVSEDELMILATGEKWLWCACCACTRESEAQNFCFEVGFCKAIESSDNVLTPSDRCFGLINNGTSVLGPFCVAATTETTTTTGGRGTLSFNSVMPTQDSNEMTADIATNVPLRSAQTAAMTMSTLMSHEGSQSQITQLMSTTDGGGRRETSTNVDVTPKNDKNTFDVVVWIVIGCLAALLLITVIAFVLVRKKSRRSQSNAITNMGIDMANPVRNDVDVNSTTSDDQSARYGQIPDSDAKYGQRPVGKQTDHYLGL